MAQHPPFLIGASQSRPILGITLFLSWMWKSIRSSIFLWNIDNPFYWSGAVIDAPVRTHWRFGIHTWKDVASHWAMTRGIKSSCLQNSCEYGSWVGPANLSKQLWAKNWSNLETLPKGISEVFRAATLTREYGYHGYCFNLELKLKPSSPPLSPFEL